MALFSSGGSFANKAGSMVESESIIVRADGDVAMYEHDPFLVIILYLHLTVYGDTHFPCVDVIYTSLGYVVIYSQHVCMRRC